MMRRESHIERAVCKRAEKLGWWALKFKVIGRAGYPDRMFLRAGKLIFVEFKAPGKKPRALQNWVFRKLHEAGFAVYVIDSEIGVERIFR
jgi:hypothetical protein